MKNSFLLDLRIEFGLDKAQIAKIVDMIYQAGIMEIESREGKRIAQYLIKMDMLELPAEEIIEELKRKGLAQ